MHPLSSLEEVCMVIAACVTPEGDPVKTPGHELRAHVQLSVGAERRRQPE
jgi:hypothetical protein